jgi:hypothetical protein
MQHYIPFIYSVDPWRPREQLIRTLVTALSGERPIQRDCPDSDLFVEGSVQRWDDKVRVRLAICTFWDCTVIRAWSRTFPVALGPSEIAALCADAVLARTDGAAAAKVAALTIDATAPRLRYSARLGRQWSGS